MARRMIVVQYAAIRIDKFAGGSDCIGYRILPSQRARGRKGNALRRGNTLELLTCYSRCTRDGAIYMHNIATGSWRIERRRTPRMRAKLFGWIEYGNVNRVVSGTGCH